MKKILLSLLIFSLSASSVFASAGSIPPESVGSIVKLKLVSMERGEVLEYLQEQSGVMISEKGHILANYSDFLKEMEAFPQLYGIVVCTNAQSMDAIDCSKEAEIVKTDDRLGVALLQVNTIWQMNTENLSFGKSFRVQYDGVTQEKFPFLYFAKKFGIPADVDESVYVLGYPKYWEGSQQITSAVVIETDDESAVLDVSLSDGTEGAAVFNEQDEFVGLITSSQESETGTYLPSSALNTFLMSTYLPDIPIAATLSVSCEKENTREKENGYCTCDYGHEWDNARGECKAFLVSDYCGPNAYRVGDYCECFEGFTWGNYADSSVVQCILLSEISDDQLSESSGGLPTYSWRDLIFKPIYEVKVFAKALRNDKALFIWKPTEGEKAKNCYFDIWGEDENKQTVIFQRKNVALVKLTPEVKHRIEISGCTVDDTEETAWTSFYVTK